MQADIVVVGSRGLGAVERVAIGSVSDQIAREAPATLVARSASTA
jgi:nucleotide-binding universal stress UspA family protein